MRSRPLVLVFLAACKLPSKQHATETDAAASSSAAAVAPAPVDAGSSAYFATAPDDAGTPPGRPAPLPKLDDGFELVAASKRPGGHVLWLESVGTRVWLSGRGLDAYADGDGPLKPAPDLLKGLPYDGAKHRIDVAGLYPHLYALRTRKAWTREETPEAAAFVRKGGTWEPAQPLPSPQRPLAFLPWGAGALIVWSTVEFEAPHAYTEKGTDAWSIDPGGQVADAKLGIDPRFVAFDASSDGTSLSLLATRGGGRRAGERNERGIWVLRGTKEKGMTALPLVDAPIESLYGHAHVVETGASAYVSPPGNVHAWSSPNTAYVVVPGAPPRPRPIAIGCHDVLQSVLVDVTIYAITSDACRPGQSGRRAFVRVTAEGRVEEVSLPRLVAGPGGYRAGAADEKGAVPCEPGRILFRPPGDLWLTLQCAPPVPENADTIAAPPFSAVLRRGHAQTPIALP